jgi:hypothetical protein
VLTKLPEMKPSASHPLECRPPEGPDLESIDHDDSLILWMLELTPTQRLAAAQGFVDSLRVLRSGRRASAYGTVLDQAEVSPLSKPSVKISTGPSWL